MRIIKLGLISLVVFALLITTFSLFFPSNVRISKAIDISAPKEKIIPLLAKGELLQLQDSIGKRLVTITSVTDSSVMYESPNMDMRGGWMIYESGNPGLNTVQWYQDYKLGWYPWEKFSGMLFEKRYGPSMERGLEKLKRESENTGQ